MGFGRLALSALAVVYGAATIAIARSDFPTTYAATSTGAAAADLAAGLGLIAAGVVATLARPVGSIGPLTTLLGVVWLTPDWVGWYDGWPPARSLGLVAAFFLLPLLVHLVLAFPAGRVVAARARVAVGLVYGAATAFSVARALVRDPFLDPYCWSNCTDNTFLAHSDPKLAQTLDTWWLRFSAAVALLLGAFALWRLLRATRTGRVALAPVLLPVALAAGAQTAYAVALLRDREEIPVSAVFRVLFVGRAVTLACVALGIAWTVGRARRARSAISRLAADLGEAPAGSLQTALASSLGDEGLEVAYWLPGSRRYVDAAGRPADPSPGRGREATPIVRNGEPVALVVHDRGIAGAHDLQREIGAAARLAVDNERLRAEVLAQLEDLRASRSRIVETGDAARRRLERDLHDGAQQRLLALSYELRVAHAEAADDADVAALLAEATGEVQAALADLRVLAHGIYPVILTEAGLAPALATLADTAPIPVDLGELGELADARYPAAVETAAYVVVAEAVADAAQRGAGYVLVELQQDDGRLVVHVEDDGSERISRLTHVTDRVGALGGEVSIERSTLRAELPCA